MRCPSPRVVGPERKFRRRPVSYWPVEIISIGCRVEAGVFVLADDDRIDPYRRIAPYINRYRIISANKLTTTMASTQCQNGNTYQAFFIRFHIIEECGLSFFFI